MRVGSCAAIGCGKAREMFARTKQTPCAQVIGDFNSEQHALLNVRAGVIVAEFCLIAFG